MDKQMAKSPIIQNAFIVFIGENVIQISKFSEPSADGSNSTIAMECDLAYFSSALCSSISSTITGGTPTNFKLSHLDSWSLESCWIAHPMPVTSSSVAAIQPHKPISSSRHHASQSLDVVRSGHLQVVFIKVHNFHLSTVQVHFGGLKINLSLVQNSTGAFLTFESSTSTSSSTRFALELQKVQRVQLIHIHC